LGKREIKLGPVESGIRGRSPLLDKMSRSSWVIYKTA